jgi:putative ABC transport system substrate-binding protein
MVSSQDLLVSPGAVRRNVFTNSRGKRQPPKCGDQPSLQTYLVAKNDSIEHLKQPRWMAGCCLSLVAPWREETGGKRRKLVIPSHRLMIRQDKVSSALPRGDRMKRREFFTLLGGAMVAWPRTARSQKPAAPRVGYIWIGVRGTDVSNAGLRQGLTDLGYVVGRNLILEERYANGNPERVPGLIAELLALNVDVLVTPGTPLTLAAQRATSALPIVCVTGDPVRTGLAASLARPGGNVTGLSLLSGDYSAKWLELLKEAAPKVRHVAMLWNPDNPGTINQRIRMQETALTLGLQLTALSVRPAEIENSLAVLGTADIDSLVVTDDPLLEPLLPRLIALAAQRRLPAIYAFSDSVQQGGLMSYSSNFFKLWRRTAGYVDRILKGAYPAELPIEQATEVALNNNLKTAKALDLNVPAALLARADEVIE